jgi:hypothetical protein
MGCCLTCWAESGMNVFTLEKLAGRADIRCDMFTSTINEQTGDGKGLGVESGHKNEQIDKKKPKSPNRRSALNKPHYS